MVSKQEDKTIGWKGTGTEGLLKKLFQNLAYGLQEFKLWR